MSDSLVSLAIEELSETQFEKFAQLAQHVAHGVKFEPTGGMHDGGLDGYYASVDDPHHFMQASQQTSTSAKIRQTIRRISQTRTINKLTYVTSQSPKDKDLLEAKIKKDTGVEIRIHGNNWLSIQCQLEPKLKSALFSQSREFVDTIRSIKDADVEFEYASKLSIVTYMEMHANSMESAEDFHVLALDSLIYEALEGTNPDTDELLAEDQIEGFILEKYPSAVSKSGTDLGARLAYLSSKQNDPRIRKHPDDRYGLPYDVRNQFSENNLSIKTAEDEFVASVNRRLRHDQTELPDELRPFVIATIRKVVIETYRRQAMNFIASFRKMNSDNDIRVFEIIDEFLENQPLEEPERDVCRDSASLIIRNLFYSSRPQERAYINLMMKYFSVHFLMGGDAAITSYFSEMAQRLRLYIGADILVRMLSEALVKPESRAMTNTIALLTNAGVKVYLTRQVMTEVYYHICSTNNEFRTEHERWFRHVQIEQTKHFDKILIRAFYYAFLEPSKHVSKPRDWDHYLSNFGAPKWYERDARSENDFGSFLANKFGLTFLEAYEVSENLDEYTLTKLTDKILALRDQKVSNTNRLLAQNDAEIMMRVTRERMMRHERVGADIYGMSTWWLTEESLVLRAAQEIGAPDDTIMNPQFLVNMYFLDPNTLKNSVNADELAMPTTFGLRITNRVSREQMERFATKVGDLADLNEAAIKARIRSAANELKSNSA